MGENLDREDRFREDLGTLFAHSSKIIAVRLITSTYAQITCVFGIVFLIRNVIGGFHLYELENDREYILDYGIPDMKHVYARMCKEHGCLREEE